MASHQASVTVNNYSPKKITPGVIITREKSTPGVIFSWENLLPHGKKYSPEISSILNWGVLFSQ